MDYRLNNEALVACLIVEILSRKSVDMLKLSIVVTYLISNNKDRCFGDKYKDCLPVVLNAALILKESGCIAVNEGVIVLLQEGVGLKRQFTNSESRRLTKIISKLNHNQSYLLESTNVQLIKSLKLVITP